jgi:hypothetical protein
MWPDLQVAAAPDAHPLNPFSQPSHRFTLAEVNPQGLSVCNRVEQNVTAIERHPNVCKDHHPPHGLRPGPDHQILDLDI